jgi:multiple sugar transport system substrate-binding protein
MIKKLAIVMVLFCTMLFAGAILWAQGGKEGSKSKASGTIRYTRWAGTQEAKDFTKLVKLFMASHPNIKVEVEFLPWGAYWDKLRTTIISGEAADVLSMSTNMSAPYVTKKALYPLNDIPGAKDLLDQMQEGTKAAVLYKDKIYGMPVGVGVRAIVYNKALFDEAKIPYPSNTKPMTWAEFKDMAQKLLKKDAKGNIVQLPAHFHKLELYEAMVVQAGGALMDNYTRPTKILLNSPEGIAGLKYMMELTKMGVLPPYTGDWSGEWGTPDSAVATGKVAMMQTGGWGLNPLIDAKINFGTAPLFTDKKRATRAPINFLAISKNCKNIDAAAEFIAWMCGEAQAEFAKTGDLPANKNAIEQAKKLNIRPLEIMEAYYSDLPYVITGPMIPSDEFGSMIETVMGDMFMEKITPEEAAATVEKDGNKLIKKIFKD